MIPEYASFRGKKQGKASRIPGNNSRERKIVKPPLLFLEALRSGSCTTDGQVSTHGTHLKVASLRQEMFFP